MENSFIASGYDIDGEKYYSLEQIGNYLFPDKWDVDAYSKVRYIYKYRKNELKEYSKKTKSRYFNQTIVVLNKEGVRKLCGFIKRSDYNENIEKLGILLNCINFS